MTDAEFQQMMNSTSGGKTPATPVVQKQVPQPTLQPSFATSQQSTSASPTPYGQGKLQSIFDKYITNPIKSTAKGAYDVTSKVGRELMRFSGFSPIMGIMKEGRENAMKLGAKPNTFSLLPKGFNLGTVITGARKGFENYTTAEDVIQAAHPDKPLSTPEAIAAFGTNIFADPLTYGLSPAKALQTLTSAGKTLKLPELATKLKLPEAIEAGGKLINKIPGIEDAKALARFPMEALSSKWEKGLEKFPKAYEAIRDVPYQVRTGVDKFGRAITNAFKGIPEELFPDMAKAMEPQNWQKEMGDVMTRLQQSPQWEQIQTVLEGAKKIGKEQVLSLVEKGLLEAEGSWKEAKPWGMEAANIIKRLRNGEEIPGWRMVGDKVERFTSGAKEMLANPYLHHTGFEEGSDLLKSVGNAVKEKWGYLKKRTGAEGYSLNLPEVLHSRGAKQIFDETVFTLKKDLATQFGKIYDVKTGLLPGYTLVDGDKAFNGVQIPSEIANALKTTFSPRAVKTKSQEIFVKAAKSVDALWRRMATSGIILPRLQFSGRNLMLGNMFNMSLVGMPWEKTLQRHAEAALEIGKAIKSNVWTPMMEKAQSLGVLGGGWSASELTGGPLSTLNKAGKLIAGEYYGKINRFVEDTSRYALWRELVEQGMDIKEAANIVRKGLFNYSEITNTQKAIRSIVPFATWKFKNLPLQLWAIWNQPGKWILPYKTKTAIESTSKVPPASQVPQTARDEFSVRSGTSKEGNPNYTIPGGSWEELNSLTPRELAMGLHPGIKTPIEMTMNKEMYSGSQIVPETKAGNLADEARKKAQADYLKRQFLTVPLKPLRMLIPNTEVGKWMGSTATEQKMRPIEALVRDITGINTVNVSPQNEPYFYKDINTAIEDNKNYLLKLQTKLSKGEISQKEYDKLSKAILDKINELSSPK